MSAPLRGRSLGRRTRFLPRRRTAARVPVGTPLRRGAAHLRPFRFWSRLLLALHDEVHILPELALELAWRRTRHRSRRTLLHSARSRRKTPLRQLEPRLAYAIPSRHPRRSGTASCRRRAPAVRVQLKRLRASRDACRIPRPMRHRASRSTLRGRRHRARRVIRPGIRGCLARRGEAPVERARAARFRRAWRRHAQKPSRTSPGSPRNARPACTSP